MASELAAAGVMIGHAASDWIRCAEEEKKKSTPCVRFGVKVFRALSSSSKEGDLQRKPS